MGILAWLCRRKGLPLSPLTPPRKVVPPSPTALLHTSQSAALMRFTFVIYEEGEEIEPNTWYQKAHQGNKNFVYYRVTSDHDWRWTEEGSVKVAGISLGTRAVDFLNLACVPDFTMYLEDEPDNPVNTHARKIMACATVNGTCVSKHLGYLPDAIATKYAGVELAISPKSVFLPPSPDLNLGLEVALRERSARFRKRALH